MNCVEAELSASGLGINGARRRGGVVVDAPSSERDFNSRDQLTIVPSFTNRCGTSDSSLTCSIVADRDE